MRVTTVVPVLAATAFMVIMFVIFATRVDLALRGWRRLARLSSTQPITCLRDWAQQAGFTVHSAAD